MSRVKRGVAALAAATLGAAVLVAAPGQAETADAADLVTVTPNPWYESETFQGWGTSLAWFANVVGGYPADLRQELYDDLFGEDGLDMQVARYNVGGGNASDVADYLRPGGAVEGWWTPDPDGSAGVYGGTATTLANKDAVLAAWDAENDAHYNWDADATQRWWVQQLAADDQITHWEVFSNSAPYFMTGSGYVSGRNSSSITQLNPAAEDKFVTYLTKVTDHIEQQYGIEVDSLEPLNEPYDCATCWFTNTSSGQPVARQEGMTVGPVQQGTLIKKLAAELAKPTTTTGAVVSAPDEVNPTRFLLDWAGYDAAAKSDLGQINVHTYGSYGTDALKVRDLAKAADRPIMMSEVEGSFGGGYNPASISNGLFIANLINKGMRELEPESWVLWQPVEDEYNMASTGENLNWGSIFIDFDCRTYVENGVEVFKSERRVAAAGGNSAAVPECGITTGAKFDAQRNYMNFIRAGDRIIATDSTDATAAVSADGSTVTLVYANSATAAKDVRVDLSRFADIAPGATVRSFTTTESPASNPGVNALVPSAAAPVDAAAKSATVSVPARSITTIVVSGASGVADSAETIVDGKAYQVVGQGSGKMLTAGATGAGATITASATSSATAPAQKWTFHELAAGGQDSTRRYVLQSGGRVLASSGTATVLKSATPEAAASDPTSIWILNSTDGRTFSLVNQATAQPLDVANGSTADGAVVGLWASSGGTNQAWTFRDLTVTGVSPVAVATLVGTAPTLPATVVPQYGWGAGQPASVTWSMPSSEVWNAAGSVEVSGVATDVFGTTADVTATVDVGAYTVTDPASVHVGAGASAATVRSAAPATVDARIGSSTAAYPTAVTWDWTGIDDADFASPGVVEVPGEAASNDDSKPPLAATLNVIVTESTDVNINPLPTTTAAATFTEKAQYTVDNTRNGIRTDKGWSNWRSGTQNASDTLTYTFGATEIVDSAKLYFYKDGTATSWAQSLKAQYLNTAGAWVDVPGYATAQPVASPADGTAPIVEVPVGGVAAKAIRFVLNAYTNTHLIVSEVEVFAERAAQASLAELATLRVGGVTVPGFDAATLDYTAEVGADELAAGDFPSVVAIPVDRSATVAVDPATAADPVTSIAVRSQDGSVTTMYRVTFVAGSTSELEVSAVTTVRCVASRPTLVVKVTNGEAAPMDLAITTPYGSKSISALAAGKSASATFTVRATSVPAGEATVVATLAGDPSRTRTLTAPFDGHTCG